MNKTNDPSPASAGFVGWIPVAERMPEKNTPVLVFTSGVVTEMEWDGYGWYYGANEVWEGIHTVTHWMPLPEPPA